MINNAVAVKPKILTSIKKFFQIFINCFFEMNKYWKKTQMQKNNIFLNVFFLFSKIFLKKKNTKRKIF